MTAIRLLGYPSPDADWLHRFRNFGEDVYVALRDRCALSLHEIDEAVDAFCIRDIPMGNEQDVAASLTDLIRKHHLNDSVFLASEASCKPKTVVLVFDPEMGERLWSITLKRATWVVPSGTNRAVVEEIWRSRGSQASAQSLTIWSNTPDTGTERGWVSIIEAVELHHGDYASDPPVDTICVYGATLTSAAASTLYDFNYEIQRSTSSGFLALKLHAA